MAQQAVVLERSFLHRIWSSRSRRVIVLIGAVVILSIADLVVTIGHLQTIGMMEANPIAAWLIRSTNSPWALTLYKLATVGVCCVLLFRVRRHLEGEIAAWCAVLILVGMSIMWHSYANHLQTLEEVHLAQTGELGDQWLMLK